MRILCFCWGKKNLHSGKKVRTCIILILEGVEKRREDEEGGGVGQDHSNTPPWSASVKPLKSNRKNGEGARHKKG